MCNMREVRWYVVVQSCMPPDNKQTGSSLQAYCKQRFLIPNSFWLRCPWHQQCQLSYDMLLPLPSWQRAFVAPHWHKRRRVMARFGPFPPATTPNRTSL